MDPSRRAELDINPLGPTGGVPLSGVPLRGAGVPLRGWLFAVLLLAPDPRPRDLLFRDWLLDLEPEEEEVEEEEEVLLVDPF